MKIFGFLVTKSWKIFSNVKKTPPPRTIEKWPLYSLSNWGMSQSEGGLVYSCFFYNVIFIKFQLISVQNQDSKTSLKEIGFLTFQKIFTTSNLKFNRKKIEKVKKLVELLGNHTCPNSTNFKKETFSKSRSFHQKLHLTFWGVKLSWGTPLNQNRNKSDNFGFGSWKWLKINYTCSLKISWLKVVVKKWKFEFSPNFNTDTKFSHYSK